MKAFLGLDKHIRVCYYLRVEGKLSTGGDFLIRYYVLLAMKLPSTVVFTKIAGGFFMKKTIIIESMFLDIATLSEKKKAQKIWDRGNKGSWTSYMLRTVKDHWDVLMSKENRPVKMPDLDRTSPAPRGMFRVNHNGQSWLEARS